ncbi:NAD(P)-dependent oxidoreductase [Streptomyces luteireticuli]|uniref:NAD(P)-dependent oxidoreductase n=1 Tax=Streptomyces luteireticuli TaxID=173858 RepID=UPI0035569BA6
MSTTPASVAVLGLGSLGTALADAFLAAGHRVTVWNRTAAKADGPVARGAVRAASPGDAAEAAELIVVCVLDYRAATLLVEEAGPRLKGRTVVNVTNGSPGEARVLAERVAALGAEYLDGGVMAVPAMIGGPEALVLYSGPEEAFARWSGVLEAPARPVHLGTDPGLAPLADLALLSGMYGMFGGFFQAAALVRSAGLPVAGFTEDLLLPWLRAIGGILPGMAAKVDSGDYSATGSTLAMQVSHDSIGDVSRAQGVSTELFAPVFELMRRGVAAGYGDGDMAAVVELLGRRSASRAG